MNGNDSVIQKLVTKFQSAFRTLEYSGVCQLLKRIEDIYKGKPIPQEILKQIAAVSLPIFYPEEYDSSKLRFSMQCEVAKFLIIYHEESRGKIMSSIVSIFEKYPHAFIGNTLLKSVFDIMAKYNTNFWVNANIELESCDTSVSWCFVDYCMKYSELRNIKNWDLVNRLLPNSATFHGVTSKAAFRVLAHLATWWEPNPTFALALLDQAMNLTVLNLSKNIPEFLLDSNREPNGKGEQIIQSIISHFIQANPVTARALGTITQKEKAIPDKLFIISLFIGLLLNIPKVYIGNMASRVLAIIKQNRFSPQTSAQICIIVSPFLPNISLVNYFVDRFTINQNDLSMFYAYLAEMANSLELNSFFPLLKDAAMCVKENGTNFGICKFMSKLLSIAALSPGCLSEHGDELRGFINIFVDGNTSQGTMISAKVVAKLLAACSDGTIVPIESATHASLKFTTAIVAYSVSFSGALIYPIEITAAALYISAMLNFEKTRDILLSHVQDAYGVVEFPPKELLFDDNISTTIEDAAKEALRWVDTPELVLKPFMSAVGHFSNQEKITSSLKAFLTSASAPYISKDSFISLVRKMSERELLFEGLRESMICVITKEPREWVNTIKECCNELQFRNWLINRVCAPLAMRHGGPFVVLEKLKVNKGEFKQMMPALKHWLNSPIVHEARAAALRFVGSNWFCDRDMAGFAVDLSLSIITRRPPPAFPERGDGRQTLPVVDFEVPVPDNRRGPSAELEAALHVLVKALQSGRGRIGDAELDDVHRALKRSNDPRVRQPYMKFLSLLGLRGMPYAAQLDSEIIVTPYF